MPLARPPATAQVSPRPVMLAAGAQLWRVHRRCRSAAEFKDISSDPHFGGNRFDSTPEDPYPFLYAARDQRTALIEALVRGIAFNGNGRRMIRRAAVAGYRITAIEPMQDLTLISLLTTTDLATACQDEWLIQTPPPEYPQTRRWGQWLRSQAPWAHGMIWPSCRNLGRHNLVLFGDRLPAQALRITPGTAIDLDDASGATWLNKQLESYRISIRPPSRRPPSRNCARTPRDAQVPPAVRAA
jgi:RES domain